MLTKQGILCVTEVRVTTLTGSKGEKEALGTGERQGKSGHECSRIGTAGHPAEARRRHRRAIGEDSGMVERRGDAMKAVIRCIIVMTVLAGMAGAKTIYVDADRPGGGGGTSWADAYNYLQDALADADAAPKPVEIRVAQGTYKPDQGAGVSSGDSFRLYDQVTWRGGYAGFGEPDPDARDVTLYETILSGDLSGNDIEVPVSDLWYEPTRSENSMVVVSAWDANHDASFVLDGFTITAAHSYDLFAGVVAFTGQLMVTDCTFVGNSGMLSGGLMLAGADGATLTNCRFIGNYGGRGAGIGQLSGAAGQAYELTNCVFNGNVADGDGGAYFAWSESPTFINCIFTNNTAGGKGGAIHQTVSLGGTANINNCVFWDNTAAENGGAVYGNAVIKNSILWGNSPGPDRLRWISRSKIQ